ncbi:MAG: hypothetical protein HY978_01750 [Candidatus Liptonbacteria bacterium]|nr:hypothetical protein [Candidatus Liptonbacteria bacterium]
MKSAWKKFLVGWVVLSAVVPQGAGLLPLVQTASAVSGQISADPQDCYVSQGQDYCTTYISWWTGGVSDAVVYVSEDGSGTEEQHFGSGSSGTRQPAAWIHPDSSYTFRLYSFNSDGNSQNPGRGAMLASVQVFGRSAGTDTGTGTGGGNPAGNIFSSPSECTVAPGQQSCATLISWWTSGVPEAVVYAFAAGASPQEQIFSHQISGSQRSPEIFANTSVTFRLYAFDPSGRGRIVPEIASIQVRALPPPSPPLPPPEPAVGSISASPNPCTITAGQRYCASDINWSVQNATQAQVWRTGPGVSGEQLFGDALAQTSPAPWISAEGEYVFRLYDYSSGSRGRQLDSVTVRANAPPVSNPTLRVSPPSANINVGQAQQYSAEYDPDGPGSQPPQNVTGLASWTSSNSGIGSHQGGGRYLGQAAGNIIVTATYQGASDTAMLTVNQTGGGPIVQTLSASGVNETSAVVSGSINPNSSPTTFSFQYGANPSSLSSQTSLQSAGAGNYAQTITAFLSGLQPVTTYYYRVVANNSFGSAQGDILNFRTGGCAGSPTIRVAPTQATVNAGASASYRAYYDSDGPSCPGGEQDVTSQAAWQSLTAQVASSQGGGQFRGANITTVQSAQLTVQYQNLTAYASLTVNPVGQQPTVETRDASGVSQNSGTLNGSVNPNSLDTTYYFEYGTGYSLGSRTSSRSAGQGNYSQSVSEFLGNLQPNTTYYFRIVGQNSQGTSQGQIKQFQTGGCQGQATLVIVPSSASVNANQTYNFQALYDSDGPSCPSGNQDVSSSASWSASQSSIAQSLGGGQFRGGNVQSVQTTQVTANHQNIQATASLTVNPTGQQPTPVTLAATSVQSNSGTVNGTVNPNGLATNYWFEYGTSYNLGQQTSQQSAGSGSTAQNFSANLSGLQPSTAYYYRIVAQNSQGTAQGQILSFQTTGGCSSGGAPYTATLGPINVGQNSAILQATVNPNGSATNYYFEYGTSASFGQVTPSQSAGSGTTGLTVTAAVSGLAANATYYYRILATNQCGAANGSSQTFQTGTGNNQPPDATTLNASNVYQNTATLNATVNPRGNAATYRFEYGTSYSLGNSTQSFTTGADSNPNNVSAYLSGLQPGTTYYFRIAASNQYGSSQGQILSFVTQTNYYPPGGGVPFVQTTGAYGNGSGCANLQGTVNPNGATASYYFEYGTTPGLGSSAGFQSIGSGSYNQSASFNLCGLQSGTNYYYRIVATNQYGPAYGSIQSFNVGGSNYYQPFFPFFGGSQPSVQTSPATGVAQNTGTLNGQVNPNGADTTAYFEYGINPNSLTLTTNPLSVGSGSGSYNLTQQLLNLQPGTTYYFRAVARNSYGTAYGQVLSFATLGSTAVGQVPTVITLPASLIYQNTALLNGQADPRGGLTNVWFEYGPSAALGLATAQQPIGSGIGTANFSAPLSGLQPGTTYYFRAVAQSQYGTIYGAILRFDTQVRGTVVVPGGEQIIQIAVAETPQVLVQPAVATPANISCITLLPSTNPTELSSDSEFTFTVSVRNGCSFNLSNGALRVVLPAEVNLISANYGYVRDTSGFLFNLGVVPAGAEVAMNARAKINAAVVPGDALIFSTFLTFNDDHGLFQALAAYLTSLIRKGSIGGATGQVAGVATTAFGASLLDSLRGLLGHWIFLLILGLLVLFLIFWLFFYRRESESGDGEENILPFVVRDRTSLEGALTGRASERNDHGNGRPVVESS